MKLIYNRAPAIQGQLEYSQRLRAPNVDIGQDIARAGQGAARFGESVARVDDEWDRAKAERAELRAYELLAKHEVELKQKRGFDAIPHAPQVAAAFRKAVEGVNSELSTEAQRRLFEPFLRKTIADFDQNSTMYSLGEGRAAKAAQHAALKDVLVQRAANAAAEGRDTEIQGILDDINIKIIDNSVENGVGEDVANAERLAASTMLHGKVLGVMLSNENPSSADVTRVERYLGKYGDEMEESTRQKYEAEVKTFGLKGWAMERADEIRRNRSTMEEGRPPMMDVESSLFAVRAEQDPVKRDMLRARVMQDIQDNSVIQREHDEPRVAQVGLAIDKGSYRSWATVEGLSQYREASDVGRQRIRNLWDQYLDKLRMSSDRARAKQGEKDNAAMLYYHSLPPEERAKLKVTLDPTGRRAIITGPGSEAFDGTSDQGTLLVAKEAKRLSAGPLVGEAEARSRLSTFAMAAENAHHFKASKKLSETQVRQKFIGYVMSQWNAYRSARPQTDDLPSEAQFMEWQSKALEEMKKEGWVWDSTKPRYLMEAEDFGEYLPPGDTQDAQTVDVQERVRADTAPVATPTGPIRMRFPDGTIRPVTPEKVDRATSLGAVRVE